jgi:hypothetical protein
LHDVTISFKTGALAKTVAPAEEAALAFHLHLTDTKEEARDQECLLE